MLLVYKKADGSEAKIRLKAVTHVPPITLGRDKAANVALDDSECSRIHAAIRYWDDMFIIRDMGSSNGTFVNGKKVDVARVSPGDLIKIGNTEIRVQPESSSTEATVVIKKHPNGA